MRRVSAAGGGPEATGIGRFQGLLVLVTAMLFGFRPYSRPLVPVVLAVLVVLSPARQRREDHRSRAGLHTVYTSRRYHAPIAPGVSAKDGG